MPKTSSANLLQIKWVYGKVQTVFCFKADDLVDALLAVGINKVPKAWYVDDMVAISFRGSSAPLVAMFLSVGVSFNFAEYREGPSTMPRISGQIRYGHDGTAIRSNLIPDQALMSVFNMSLRHCRDLNPEECVRVGQVCCGQESWDNREENGQMHKMRNLLSQ